MEMEISGNPENSTGSQIVKLVKLVPSITSRDIHSLLRLYIYTTDSFITYCKPSPSAEQLKVHCHKLYIWGASQKQFPQ